MLWKYRRKRSWIFLILTFSISLILMNRISTFSLCGNDQNENPVNAADMSKPPPVPPPPPLIERVQVSHVIALNKFINAAPTPAPYYAYNRRLSDKIGAYRADMPDTRNQACRARNYYLHRTERLKVSIVIAFHNEARSTLMRTIMSVYRRTPSKYLHEIILLDDHSDDALLLSTLCHLDVPPFQNKFYNFANATSTSQALNLAGKDDNVTNILNVVSKVSSIKNATDFTVIKMQRNSRRLGLIESRNLGARLATGDYLLFLDSHCEVNVGWLEPLLDRLVNVHAAYNVRTNAGGRGATNVAVSPVLDSIDAATLQYRATSQQLMGGFDWNLHFHWIRRRMDGYDRAADDDTADAAADAGSAAAETQRPFKSPVFSGGIFMVDRKYFLQLNGFNSQLEIWGGESIEFSIKLWLCGGQIEIVPCSRVGHIFRKEHPFQFPNAADGQATYLRNSKIIAESWLDSYKYLFYALKPKARHIRLNISYEDLEAFKLKLQCKTFDWYLSHVFPQLRLPNEDFFAYGKLSAAERCLHIQQPNDAADPTVQLSDQKSPIISSSSSSSHIRLQMTNCYHSDITHWYLHRYSARLHSSNGACLNVVWLNRTEMPTSTSSMNLLHFAVVLQYCHKTAQTQRWIRRGAQLIHEQTHLCLDNPLNDVVAVSHCRHSAPTQLFRFTMEIEKL